MAESTALRPGRAAILPAEPNALDLFEVLRDLGPFRVIHQSGASTFEAIVPIAPAEIVGPYLNVICDAYHWHLRLSGLGHVQTFDTVHGRSGRRVCFLTLADAAPDDGGEVFARLYMHRPKGADFDPQLLAGFLSLHARLGHGLELAPCGDLAPQED